MKKRLRLIPRLDIKGPNLVKGIHLEGLRVLGDPAVFARNYYSEGADELIFMDVVASLYERNSLHEIVKKTCQDVFIPITCGGGIRSLDDIKSILRAGADKVAINTAAAKRPEFIREASLEYGSSTIVLAVEAIKQPDGRYLAFIDNGREHTGLDVFEWVERAQELGAGEIMITSVDREGTGLGFDKELITKVCRLVNIPVIAHGGAGSSQDILELAMSTEVSAIAPASILHYDLISRIDTNGIGLLQEGNSQFLKSGQSFSRIKTASLGTTKNILSLADITTRQIRGNYVAQ